MRRRRDAATVSLFPFLSVLLCTLGALIFLLLVLDHQSRRARATESARREAEVADQADRVRAAEEDKRRRQLEERGAALDRSRATLEAERRREAEQQKLLELKRLALAETEAAIAREKARAAKLEEELRAGSGKLADMESARRSSDAELARLLRELAALEALVRRLEEAARAKRQPRYSLIPYQGKQGTTRPPIYLECTNDSARFQPDGEKLALGDFVPRGRFVDVLKAKAEAVGESGEKPYLLVLIRPSGIPYYYAAIRALKGQEVDIGYELIGEDWVIDYAAPRVPAGSPLVVGTLRVLSPLANLPGGSGRAPGDGTRGVPPTGSPSAPGTLREPSLLAKLSGGAGGTPGDAAPSAPNPIRNERTTTQRNEPPPQPGEKPRETKTGGGGTPTPVRPVPIADVPRDWEIVIECRENQIDVTTLKKQLDPKTLKKGENPLAESLGSAIAERRRGVPDLRTRIRFVIHPDGLRTYYAAAAAVDDLKLPATWVILEE